MCYNIIRKRDKEVPGSRKETNIMTAKEEVKQELERRLASREDTKKEIEVNAYFLESLFRRLKNGEDVVN